MSKLPVDFYAREDVVLIARELLGKNLCTRINGVVTKGIITETEAYAGEVDRASHAYGGRRTNRTETMYGKPGISYVYLCYGVHSLFNVVTNQQDIPHAVLVRGIYPIEGETEMIARRGRKFPSDKLTDGPGKVTSALGIHFREHNGLNLLEDTVWIEDGDIAFQDKHIHVGPRVGVDYAKEDALLPYRFLVKDTKAHFGGG